MSDPGRTLRSADSDDGEEWIVARRKPSAPSYPQHTARGGKWLVFVNEENVDEVWPKLRAATESGLLGEVTKASKRQGKTRTSFVIYVYTYDADDDEDVSRVREALRALGVTERIPYKTDADTRSGRSKSAGDKDISKRYE